MASLASTATCPGASSSDSSLWSELDAEGEGEGEGEVEARPALSAGSSTLPNIRDDGGLYTWCGHRTYMGIVARNFLLNL